MSRNLPEFPNLEHLKKQAKVLLRELQRRNPATKLAEAQHAIAQDHGFASWSALKAHVESLPPAPATVLADAALRALDGAALHAGKQFWRYTEKARTALFFSRYEASRYASSQIEPEHVLLGLIREGQDFTARLFDRSRLSLKTVRTELEGQLQEHAPTRKEEPASAEAMFHALMSRPGDLATTQKLVDEISNEGRLGVGRTTDFNSAATGVIPLGPNTKRVLQYAAEEADRLRHTDLGTPHLLLGLLSLEDSVAASILTEKGMRLDEVRNDVVQVLSEEPI